MDLIKTYQTIKYKAALIGKILNAKVETRRISTVSNRDIFGSHPTTNLTPEKLAIKLRNAESGDISEQMELFEEFEEKDLHINSCLNDRKRAITNKDFKIKPVSENSCDLKVAEYGRELIENIDNWDEALYDVLDAVGKGLSLSEIMWKPGDILRIETIDYVLPQKITFNDNLTEIRLITEESPVDGISLIPNKFVLHKCKAKSGHINRSSILRICAYMFLFKNYSIKDWVTFAEIYGMPLRIGKYGPGADEAEKSALEKALSDMGVCASALIPADSEIEIKESDKRASAEIYEKLARYCDEQISKGIVGATLTKDIGKIGSYGASETHQDVKEELVQADACSADKTITKQILKPAVEYQFGPGTAVPEYETIFPEKIDYKEALEIWQGAVDLNVPVAVEDFYKKFNIPVPKKGAALLQKSKVYEGAGDLFDPEKKEKAKLAAKQIFTASQDMDSLALKQARVKQNRDNLLITGEKFTQEGYDIYDKRMSALKTKLKEAQDYQSVLQKISEEKWDAEASTALGEKLFEALKTAAVQGILDARIEAKVFSAKGEGGIPDPFSLIPEKALEYLKVYSFGCAAINEKNALENVKAGLERALRDGTSYADFYNENGHLFTGWGNHYIKTVFNTNIQSVYMAGKYWEYNDPDYVKEFPYFQYIAIDDDIVRDSHLAMNGRIFRRDDAIWDIWWPPNGFNCRCDVMMVSEYEVRSRGLVVESSTGGNIPKLDSTGFDRNLGKTSGLLSFTKELFDKYGIDINKTYQYFNLKSIDEMSGEVLERSVDVDTAQNLNKPGFKKILKIENETREIIDFENEKIKLNARLYDKFTKQNSSGNDQRERFTFVEYIEPTLLRPDEVWGKIENNNTRKIYIKRFVDTKDKNSNFLMVVELDSKDVVTWIKIDKTKDLNNQRKGILLYYKK